MGLMKVALLQMTGCGLDLEAGLVKGFDPIAYVEGAPEEGPGRDTFIVEAGEHEGVFIATFDMDAIRDYRRREAWGNSFRRPRLYGALTGEEVEPPFVRADATR